MATKEIGRPFVTSPNHQKQSVSQSIARKLRAWTVVLVPLPTKSNSSGTINVVCISDTHNTKLSLPDDDILFHAGDLSQYGLFDEIQAQLDWLNTQPQRHKVVIAGNHDLILDEAFVKLHPDRELDRPWKSRGDLDWGQVIYLKNSSVEVECNGRILKIYGSPMTPKCGNFGFQYDSDENIWANTIPDDTDIVLTHGPPAMHLDEGKGCRHLLAEIWRTRPTLLVYGHIHDGRGEEIITFCQAQGYYENVILGVRPWSNLLKLMLYIVSHMLRGAPVAGERPLSTHSVNAAMVASHANEGRREPIVTCI